MADAGLETKGGSERSSGRAPPGQRGSAAQVAPLGPEQLQRVLEQVKRVQPPPTLVLQDAARRLQEAAQQAAVQQAPGADPPRLPRLLPPQQLEAICVKVTSGDTKGQEKPALLLATIQAQPAGQSLLPKSQLSPVGLRMQPVAPQGPVPTKRVKAAPASCGQGPTPIPSISSELPMVTPAAPGSAHVFPSGLRLGPAEKFRKTLKVKTRSGRISRPPKHKAKDYKFIRTEDLVAGRLSDSDDYSDLSAGDEEERQDLRLLFTEASCALRPRAFRCQACDKAYIGQGGLARHWRLNPGHSWQQPEKGYTETSPRGLTTLKWSTPESCVPKLCTMAAFHQHGAEAAQGSPQCIEDEEVMVLEPESSAAVSVRSRTAQPRACSRARLQELLQQCAPEDLVELALPRLAQVATVYEFLLAKAKDGGTAQPCFLAVYREFEELHCRVRSMYQEHLGRASPASGESLEVSNPQAAEQVPPVWRPQQAALPMGCPEHPAAHSGDQEICGLSPPAAGLGFIPPASETTPPPSEGIQELAVSGGDTSMSHAGWKLKASADSEARPMSTGPIALGGDCHGAALDAQLLESQENVPDARTTQGNPGVLSTLSPMGEASGVEPGDPGARPVAPLPEELLPIDVMPVGYAQRTGPDRSPLTTGSHA